MAVPPAILDDLASVLRIELEGSPIVQPGQPLTAKVIPPASDLRATDVLSLPASLTWITKSLIFAAGQTGLQGEPLAAHPPVVAGPMPIADVTRVLTAVPGIPGLLGQLDALVPIPIQVPVGLRIAWSIQDEQKHPVAQGDSTYSTSDDLGQFDSVMKKFITSGPPEMTFVFVPQTIELTTDLPTDPGKTTATYTVNAKVQVFVGDTASTAIDLPAIPIHVPAIPIPFVAAFFRHTDFQAWSDSDEGFALIVVPSNSRLRSVQQFQNDLPTLQTAVASLQQFTSFATLAVGLAALIDNVAGQPYIVLKALDAIDDLKGVQIKNTSLSDWSGINANDEISSLIVVGPKNHTVVCDNETGSSGDSSADEGEFTVTIGSELYVTVRNLEIDSNQAMGSDPAGKIQIGTMPSSATSAATFNDELSSVSLHR